MHFYLSIGSIWRSLSRDFRSYSEFVPNRVSNGLVKMCFHKRWIGDGAKNNSCSELPQALVDLVWDSGTIFYEAPHVYGYFAKLITKAASATPEEQLVEFKPKKKKSSFTSEISAFL